MPVPNTVADVENFRVAAQATVQQGNTAATQAAQASTHAAAAMDRAKEANAKAELAASAAKNAMRDAAKLNAVPPPGVGDPAATQFAQQSAAASGAAAGVVGVPAGAQAASGAKQLCETESAKFNAINADVAGKQNRIATLQNAPTLAQAVPQNASVNQLNTRIERFQNSSDEADQIATGAQAKATEASQVVDPPQNAPPPPPPPSPIGQTNAAVAQAGNIAAAMQPVYQAALDAAAKIPYNSNNNAAEAKKAIDAAKKAAEDAAKAEDLCKKADQELDDAKNELKKAKDEADRALKRALDQTNAAVRGIEAAKKNRLAELKKKQQDLDKQAARLAPKVMEREQKLKQARDAVDRAKKAAAKPSSKVGEEECAAPADPAAAEQVRRAEEAFTNWKERQNELQRAIEETADEAREVQSALADRNGMAKEAGDLPAVQKAKAAFQEATDRRKEIEQALGEIEQLVKEIKDACAAAKKAAQDAAQAKDQAVDKRIDQLMAEGHGPQRHEGQVSPQELGERAVYKIDPETHSQLDAESGELHSADAVASKFTTKENYVMAESIAREELMRVNPPGPGTEVLKPLTMVGSENKVAEGIKSTWDPAAQPKVQTDKGLAKQIPTQPGYVPGPADPPPTRLQMDENQMKNEIAAHTQPADFTNGEMMAIYRKDAAGNWYLRTMWSQPA